MISNLSFLVVEDHDFQRRMLVKTLERLGATVVHEAADGQSALDIVHDPQRSVDIIITDLDMPGMDGMEFLRHLGAAGLRVSLILVSALERKLLASIATMSEAYGINLLGCIEKPLTPANLLPLIQLHRPEQAQISRAPDDAFTLEEILAGLKSDEFEAFFQPKIDLATGQATGAEALARWRHPRQGIVAPMAFIGALEQADRIDDLTWVMLTKAAAFCRTWRATGTDAKVSVNLSPRSLGAMHIADHLTEIVRSQAVEPKHMVLELTETAAATDAASALENLARLRMKGFGLSIDDYGTGYSSMQQLTRIAFTELKIDQSFVTNAAKQNSARVILESSLEMARKLNITSVAEGVETREGFDLLCHLRCDMVQGYFIARPMDASAYLDWVREWKQPVSCV